MQLVKGVSEKVEGQAVGDVAIVVVRGFQELRLHYSIFIPAK